MNVEEPESEPRECRMCEIIGSMFGIAIGTVLLFISIDVLTRGAISTFISGGLGEDDE